MVSNEKTYKYNMKRIAVLAVIILVTFISLWIILNKYMLSVIGRQAKSSVSDIVMQQANVISTIINDISLSTENTAKVLEKSNGDEYSKYLNTVNYASAVGITDNEGNVICGDKIDVEMDYYQKLII